MTNRNRLEYELRVNRVLDYIRQHLNEELTLETLAQVAAFSPFHFHRVFKTITGENLIECVQRTRLESAASQLASRPQVDVLEIALDCGFNSASAFARAFRERFGMSATEWRSRCTRDASKTGGAESKMGEVNSNVGTAMARDCVHDRSWLSDDARQHQEDIMNVIVKNLPNYHVAYMRHTGPFGAEGGIPQLWQRLARWASARDLWTTHRICLGMVIDDPMVTEPAKCRYDAAIVIPDGYAADGGVNIIDVPGGKHATVAFEGSARDIAKPWHQLFTWLPQSGFQPEHRPSLELYTGDAWDTARDLFRCEVCLPVRPL